MKNLVLVLTMFVSVKAMALTEQQESYAMFCGSVKDLTEMAESKGEKITKKDIAEINKTRESVLLVLKNGEKGITKLLEAGNKTDAGPFGAIMACGMIDQLKNEISIEGCYDLKTNKAVKDNGGVAACGALLAKLPH